MRAYLRPVLCALLVLAAGVAIDANAQNAEAQAHAAAAKAAARPSVANPKQQFHAFERLFEQTCSPPTLPDQIRAEAEWR
jgi:cytochrome c5